jgi:hypothetical protein
MNSVGEVDEEQARPPAWWSGRDPDVLRQILAALRELD